MFFFTDITDLDKKIGGAVGDSSTNSLRPQPKKVGGWEMAIFEKKLKIV